jgi:hypothetical protein
MVASIWLGQERARRGGQRDEVHDDWMSQVTVIRDPLQDNPTIWPEFVPDPGQAVN